jgi:hypothetical protein
MRASPVSTISQDSSWRAHLQLFTSGGCRLALRRNFQAWRFGTRAPTATHPKFGPSRSSYASGQSFCALLRSGVSRHEEFLVKDIHKNCGILNFGFAKSTREQGLLFRNQIHQGAVMGK